MKFIISKILHIAKNVIIFIPLLLSEQEIDGEVFINYFNYFLLFSISSLLVYFINDYYDYDYGICIMANAVIKPGCKINRGSIINTWRL